MIVKPNRKPDYKYARWHFYFEEMVQWNSTEKRMYKIRYHDLKLEYTDLKIEWTIWYGNSDIFTSAYLKWRDEVTERVLLQDTE